MPDTGSWTSSTFTATNIALDLLVAIAYSTDVRNIEHLDRLHGNHYDVFIKHKSGNLIERRMAKDKMLIPLGKPVINQTGIPGTFNIDLRFAPEGSELSQTGTPRPSIFTAVQKQLGLKLEPQKITTDILVIDSCQPVPTGN
ncbi:MAG TPA: TIGR03435 family protein [Bryobacteraceae bacterium]|nr:TIGR03435 family protein [Bryobacteraceae bacterium]